MAADADAVITSVVAAVRLFCEQLMLMLSLVTVAVSVNVTVTECARGHRRCPCSLISLRLMYVR